MPGLDQQKAAAKVLALHQTNRQGRDQARKDGRYTSTSALSWAHEAERSASVITTSLLDDQLRKTSQVRIQNLKNRDNPLFPELLLDVDFSSGWISWRDSDLAADPNEVEEDLMADL